jgi:hypothetical protein
LSIGLSLIHHTSLKPPSGWFFTITTISCAACAVGISLDFDDNCALDEPIEESHSERAVSQVVSPSVEVNVRDQRGRALLVARSDDLVKQVGSLRRFQSFDTIKTPFINDQQLRAAVNTETLGQSLVRQGSGQVGDKLGGRAIQDTIAEGTGFEADGLDQVALSDPRLADDDQVRPAFDELACGYLLYLLPVDRLAIEIPVEGLQGLVLGEVSIVDATRDRAFPPVGSLLSEDRIEKAQGRKGLFLGAKQCRVESLRRDRDAEDRKMPEAALTQRLLGSSFSSWLFPFPWFAVSSESSSF